MQEGTRLPDVVLENLLHFGLHLLALGFLDLADFGDRVDFYTSAVDLWKHTLLLAPPAHSKQASKAHLDFVRVQRGVGDQDARLLDALGLTHTDSLVEDETALEVRLLQRTTGLHQEVCGERRRGAEDNDLITFLTI